MTVVVLTILSFLCGSLMFSYWLGRYSGKDLRSIGDGNPGAANAFKAAGPVIGAAALLLDFAKGMAPLGAAVQVLHVGGWALVPIGIAPVLGHAFSPFLRLRGGKAIAVTFGTWCGITLWEAPCVLGAALLLWKFVLRVRGDARVVMSGMLTLLVYLAARQGRPPLLVLCALQTALLAWTHRRELAGR